MRDRWYILHGKNPVAVGSLEEWARGFGELDTKHVAQDMIGDVKISTVFLGLDHNHFHNGPPILFETMIFGGPHDEYQERCSTWEQAEKMHAEAVALVKSTLS